jgi:hypothetical protein
MSAININTFQLSELPAKETDEFEFKSSATSPKGLAEKLGCAVSGFANSGGGTFVAGVDDDTGDADGGLAIEGFVGRQPLLEWADQVIHCVEPTPRYRLGLITNSNGRGTIDAGKAVLVVSVEESHDGPHMAPDRHYYIRAGRHTLSARHFIVEAIWANRQISKPRIAHLVRQSPNDTEVVQIGLVALTDSPAVDVQVTMQPQPGVARGHNFNEFPVSVGTIDRQYPFFFDITTRSDTERNHDEEFALTVTYQDLASNSYKYEKRVNLFRSLPSLRFFKKGIDDVVTVLEKIASELEAKRS